VVFLYSERRSAGTVKSNMLAARYTHMALGFWDPNIAGMPQLKLVIKGIRNNSS